MSTKEYCTKCGTELKWVVRRDGYDRASGELKYLAFMQCARYGRRTWIPRNIWFPKKHVDFDHDTKVNVRHIIGYDICAFGGLD